MWLSYAPIPDITADFYNITLNQVDWFSIIYFITSLVIGLVSIFILDTFGLKVSVRIRVCFFVCLFVCFRYLSLQQQQSVLLACLCENFLNNQVIIGHHNPGFILIAIHFMVLS